jgi:uncharacterized protein involved in response to NO
LTRASLGRTWRPTAAGPCTTAIYGLVTLAAILRLLAPLGGTNYLLMLNLAGVARSGAFGLYALFYARVLVRPRVSGRDMLSI